MGLIRERDIRQAVRETFNRVADAPTESYRFRVGRALARDVGYPEAVLSSMPSVASESFTGLAYLFPYAGLRPGDRVIDVGCGAGLDAVLAASLVKTVAGVDLSDAMVSKAAVIARQAGVTNVEFRRAEAECLPFLGDTFDVVLVNGLFNLCPNKQAVARELYRVLVPGGRLLVAEITFHEAAPRPVMKTADDWFR